MLGAAYSNLKKENEALRQRIEKLKSEQKEQLK